MAVRLLHRTEIEAYLAPEAVLAWFLSKGRPAEDVESDVARIFDSSNRKRGLSQLTERVLGSRYDVVLDGLAIANLMEEHAIAPEIRDVIYGAVGDEPLGPWAGRPP